jgi:hypothetical protein
VEAGPFTDEIGHGIQFMKMLPVVCADLFDHPAPGWVVRILFGGFD